jgi:transposase
MKKRAIMVFMAPGIKHPRRGEALELWLQGHSCRNIAKMLSVTDRSVRDWRDADGWPEQKITLPKGYDSSGRKEKVDAEFAAVREELAVVWEKSIQPRRVGSTGIVMQGSAHRVAEHFGWSPSKTIKFLKRAGLLTPRPSNKTHGGRAAELFESGWSVPRIATEVEVSEDTIRSWLKKRGLDLSNHHDRRSHEEKIAFRQAISDGRGGSVVGNGRFKYNDVRMDSSWEVRFAKNLDRLGVEWTVWDRERDGTVEIPGEVVGRYSPDFLVGDLPVEIKGVYDATAALKVSTWRKERGRLAVVMRNELLELESARTAEEAIAILQAFCYLDPPARRDGWS